MIGEFEIKKLDQINNVRTIKKHELHINQIQNKLDAVQHCWTQWFHSANY